MARPYLVVWVAVVSLLLATRAVSAHEAATPLVIDTDMALDDARALILLLQDPDTRVLAVITSDGGSSPCDGATRVFRLLQALEHPGVPVGVGRESDLPAPAWRDVAGAIDALGSGDTPDCDRLPGTAEVVAEVLKTTPDSVTWVALGPLTNLAEIIRASPEVKSRIRAVYYVGGEPGAVHPGWNLERDRDAAAAVFHSGIPIYAVPTGETGSWIHLDADWTDDVARIDSPAAKLIVRLHRHPMVAELLERGHAQAWDDTVSLALLAPSAFTDTVVAEDPTAFRLTPVDPELLNAIYLAALRSSPVLSPRQSVVLNHYPMSPESFRSDVAPFVTSIQRRHGVEEWKAAVLTSELHRHLGIYSLIGVKMGIRAREILDAPLDDLEVESHAGLTPPVSCLNDGLQVSTGASLGRGTIRVAEGDGAAEASFMSGSKRLRMTLRPEVRDRIRADVKSVAQRHGSLGSEYFEEIRRLSIRYWMELNRREIFLEELAEEPARQH